MIKKWLLAPWRAWLASYDPEEVRNASHPGAIAIAAGGLIVVLAALAYVPPLSEGSQFKQPWVALILAALGGLCSYMAWRYRARGLGAVATLFDNVLYSASLTYASAQTSAGFSTGLAITHGLMVLAIPVRFYGLTAVFATVFAVPLVLVLYLYRPTTQVTEILVCTYIIALLLSYMTRRKRAYLAAQAKLTRAFGAANQLADESVQTALASTLLSLGHFLHELKNYQTAVGVNLVYLQRTTELDAGGKEALREALAAQVAEQKLVVDTIDALRRRAKPSNSVFMLRELVEHVARDTPGIEVRVDAGEERFLVTGVPDHLRIVLTNLIRNAEQAGATEVLVQLRLEPSGHAVRMIVSDDGPGIPESRRQGLFEPFGGTTKLGGTGLGLYLCRRHVELFGGTIALEPGPLGGASFVIRLPARAVCEAEPAEEGSGPRAKAG